MWPFRNKPKLTRNPEIEQLRLAVSKDRSHYYESLVKLDDATKAFDKEGVRGMLGEMLSRMDEGHHRG